MRVVLSWLNEFADFNSLSNSSEQGDVVSIMVEAMNSLGLVVEGVERSGFNLDGVVVARVLEVHSIEGADRIRRIVVDAGRSETEQIVCGAFNFGVGDQVPLARPGVVLPGDFAISPRKMKGVASNGMLCSAKELGLGLDLDGLMILDPSLAPGLEVTQALGITPEVVFDLAIEANRPDANSHIGVARELACYFDLDFSGPEVADLSSVEVKPLDDGVLGEGATSLIIANFEGTSLLEAPPYVARRLELAGMRSISPVVDVSNYVMLEVGQPTHPYDLTLLPSSSLVVRSAKPKEEIVTLDGVVRTLAEPRRGSEEPLDLVIADSNDSVVGIAGIMGGHSSEIASTTNEVILEIAHFRSDLIAKTSKRLGLRSEASARFERGVDPLIGQLALGRFSFLLGTSPTSIAIARGEFVAPVIEVRPSRIVALLGSDIPISVVAKKLGIMGFEIDEANEATLMVTPPSNRPDIRIEADVIEEFARHFGYSNIQRHQLLVPNVGRLSLVQRKRRELVGFCVAKGFYEAWSSTLLGPDEQRRLGDYGRELSVSNPMVAEESILRRSMLAGLLRGLIANVRRREETVALFEVGKVFSYPKYDQALPDESEHGAWLFYRQSGLGIWGYDLYLDLISHFGVEENLSVVRLSEIEVARQLEAGYFGMHPNNTLAILRDGEMVGVCGEINPFVVEDILGEALPSPVVYMEMDLDKTIFGEVATQVVPAPSQFPSAEFDLSFGVERAVLADMLAKEIQKGLKSYASTIELIDAYEGPALRDYARSLTYRINVASFDHTLTDAEIRAVRNGLIDQVERAGLGKLRD
ncbi:phenylalanine--tRNA ligase subunit beta [Acidithrix ferrooxidans]|uniref:Phenylalanine--tRNA ligase beta subunit n=1 Tax=Acidithrix ferrooxidans TaxID=1280514 RepID=A0A0D8HFD3_9ACTN|nr:phenylalanine--tRNA ligase subunit beta [Acidithrix ferrooxidans]KJF16584.1 phenylalanine--tRNA ligase beta subunit [Acidithrix ferrooxidans]